MRIKDNGVDLTVKNREETEIFIKMKKEGVEKNG